MKPVLTTIIMVCFFIIVKAQSAYDNYKLSNSTIIPKSQSIDADFYLEVQEIKRRQSEKAEIERKAKAHEGIERTKEIYNSFKTFPDAISNGWYNVTVIIAKDFCEERKVFIENQEIKKYVIDNWNERPVIFSGKIVKGKALIKLEDSYLDVYFLESIINPTFAKTTPPLLPGKISFWTNYKRAGNVDLYVNDYFIGTLKSYFDGEPNCEQDGVITYTYKPGTYNFEAKSESKSWNGTITVYENQCLKQKLTK